MNDGALKAGRKLYIYLYVARAKHVTRPLASRVVLSKGQETAIATCCRSLGNSDSARV
jgi:hypothetical protein